MKDKIFSKLKQAYSSLGLGDAILMGHAEALAGLNLVTEDNIDTVVNAQKSFLEQLQRSNDKRVQDAISKSKEAEKAAADAAAKAAEEARAKAVEDAIAKARNEVIAEMEQKAREAEKAAAEKAAAEKAAAEKAAAEEARAKANQIPEWYTRDRQESERSLNELRQLYTSQTDELRKQLQDAANAQAEEFRKQMEESRKAAAEQAERISALTKENEQIKQAAVKAERMNFISAKAKDMGIPQYRIDEGFAGINENSTDDEIVGTLANIARNVKANQLPENTGHYVLGDGEPTKAEVDNLAKSLIKF